MRYGFSNSSIIENEIRKNEELSSFFGTELTTTQLSNSKSGKNENVSQFLIP